MCRFVLFYKKNELQGPPSVTVHPLAPISVKKNSSKDTFSPVWFAGKLIGHGRQRVKAAEVSYGMVCLGVGCYVHVFII